VLLGQEFVGLAKAEGAPDEEVAEGESAGEELNGLFPAESDGASLEMFGALLN